MDTTLKSLNNLDDLMYDIAAVMTMFPKAAIVHKLLDILMLENVVLRTHLGISTAYREAVIEEAIHSTYKLLQERVLEKNAIKLAETDKEQN